MPALAAQRVALLAQAACVLEASAPKPGNVAPGKRFADTGFEDFVLSAVAVGPAFARVGHVGVGELVLDAVRATRAVVGVNTNLGILLLLAPLAQALVREGGALRERVAQVLRSLTLADASAVYAAIRLLAPGGLGTAPEQDVRDEPSLPLRQVMLLAADRDSVAREYATDYDVTFRVTLPALRQSRKRGLDWTAATLEAYLHVLAEVPDTLIARKLGLEAARRVSARAREVLAAGDPTSLARARATDAFDRELRTEGNRLNPGTTADLMAAGLLVALAEES